MEIKDLVIIGGGPAGCSAGVYAARKKINTVFITESFGGQSVVSENIYNWIGTKEISGIKLAENLENHIREYEGDGFEVVQEKVISVKDDGNHFSIKTNDKEFLAKTLFLSTGSDRRKLSNVKGADVFEHKGLTYCASCDGPLFTGQDVVVVGGGNAGFETAAQLMAYTKSVTILQRSGKYKADKITVDKVLAAENVKGILNAQVAEVYGDNFVKGIKYKKEEEIVDLAIGGIFVEIGLIPNTKIFEGMLEFDEIGRIKIDTANQTTSNKRIWAAGDCSNVLYHQNNIAAGDAVKAIENLYLYLKTI